MFKMYFECEFFQLLLRSDGLVLKSVEFVGFGGENKPCKLLERACEELEMQMRKILCLFLCLATGLSQLMDLADIAAE